MKEQQDGTTDPNGEQLTSALPGNRKTAAVTRRRFLASATGVGAGMGLSELLPSLSPALQELTGLASAATRVGAAQAQSIPGKERLIVRSLRPEDLETPPSLLNTWLTPNDLFYVRHHSYAPALDQAVTKAWTVRVDGAVESPLSITLDELKRMPKATVTVTLECAGNGRAFFDPPVAGIQWEKGAVGTARWTGVRLADLLKRVRVRATGKYVLFDGADKPVGKMPDFQRNVPLDKALHPDTILAYEMNDQPLPPLHGYPLRAIIPGWEGAYAVKWLDHVRVLEAEHDGFFVKTAYRYPNIRVAPGAPVPPENMLPVTGLVVKSLIHTPAEGATFAPGPIRIAGFAWAGETAIRRVDVSLDQGATWVPARLGSERVRYAWQSFEYQFSISKPGSYLLMARATDEQGRMQPVAPHWNPSGYLWNVIDRVRITVHAS